jgi:hypothetical protein
MRGGGDTECSASSLLAAQLPLARIVSRPPPFPPPSRGSHHAFALPRAWRRRAAAAADATGRAAAREPHGCVSLCAARKGINDAAATGVVFAPRCDVMGAPPSTECRVRWLRRRRRVCSASLTQQARGKQRAASLATKCEAWRIRCRRQLAAHCAWRVPAGGARLPGVGHVWMRTTTHVGRPAPHTPGAPPTARLWLCCRMFATGLLAARRTGSCASARVLPWRLAGLQTHRPAYPQAAQRGARPGARGTVGAR